MATPTTKNENRTRGGISKTLALGLGVFVFILLMTSFVWGANGEVFARERGTITEQGGSDAPTVVYDQTAALSVTHPTVTITAEPERTLSEIVVVGTTEHYALVNEELQMTTGDYNETFAVQDGSLQANLTTFQVTLPHNGTYTITATDSEGASTTTQLLLVDTVLELVSANSITHTYNNQTVLVTPVFYYPVLAAARPITRGLVDWSDFLVTMAEYNLKKGNLDYYQVGEPNNTLLGMPPRAAGTYFATATVSDTPYRTDIQINQAGTSLPSELTARTAYVPVISFNEKQTKGTLQDVELTVQATSQYSEALEGSTRFGTMEDGVFVPYQKVDMNVDGAVAGPLETRLNFVGGAFFGSSQVQEYYVEFVPTDQNYKSAVAKLNLTLYLDIDVRVDHGKQENIARVNEESTKITPEEGGDPAVTLVLDAVAGGNYYFVAWGDTASQVVGIQPTLTKTDLQNEQDMKYQVTAHFSVFSLVDTTRATLAEKANTDDDSDALPNVFTSTYSGAAANFIVSTSNAALNTLGVTGMTATVYSYANYLDNPQTAVAIDAPTAEGDYVVAFVVRITQGQEQRVIRDAQIKYVIRAADLLVARTAIQPAPAPNAYISYDCEYVLTTSQMVAGGITKFQYSLDGGITWTDFLGAATYTSGKAYTQTVSASEMLNTLVEHDGMVKFRAVKEADVVAVSGGSAMNIDRRTPDIRFSALVAGEEHASNAWASQTLTFAFAAGQVGATGAYVEYSKDQGATWTRLKNEDGTDFCFASNTSKEMQISEDQNRGYLFRRVSGTGAIVKDGTDEAYISYVVKLDTFAPSITYVSGKVGTDVWQKNAVRLTFTASDTGSGTRSQVASIAAVGDGGQTINFTVTGGTSTTFVFDVPNYDTYTLVATDHAGNQSTTIVGGYNADNSNRIQEKVDTAVPVFTLDESSTKPNVWDDGEPKLVYDVAFGASGARFQYSEDNGENWTAIENGDLFFEEGNANAYQQNIRLTITLPKTSGAREVLVRGRSGADGAYGTHTFGTLLVDISAPVFAATGAQMPDGTTNSWFHSESHIRPSIWLTEEREFHFLIKEQSGLVSISVQNTVLGTTLTLTPYAEHSEAPTTTEGGNVVVRPLPAGCSGFAVMLGHSGPYLVTMVDALGYESTYTFKANIEIQDEIAEDSITFSHEAFQGASEDAYQAGSGWISTASEENKDYLRLLVNMTFTSSGGLVQWAKTTASTVEPTDGSWKNLTDTLYGNAPLEDGGESTTYLDPYQRYVGSVAFREEMNGFLWLRTATGAGLVSDAVCLGLVQIDYTAPNYQGTHSFYIGDRQVQLADLEANFHGQAVTLRYKLSDGNSGVSANANDHALYSYPIGSEVGTLVSTTVDPISGYYVATLDAYLRYVIVAKDVAGNESAITMTPKIDTTALASASMEATNAGAWVKDAGTNIGFVLTAILANEQAAFGPSGGVVEFERNGDGVWLTAFTIGESVQTFTWAGLVATMTLSENQNTTYRFRVRTGATLFPTQIVVLEDSYQAKKDASTPTISVVLKTATTGVETAGKWTAENLVANLSLVAGLSGATYQVARHSQMVNGEKVWQNQSTVSGGSSTRDYRIEPVVQGIRLIDDTYYFRVVSNAGTASAEQSVVVRHDRTIPTFSVSLLAANDDSYVQDTWAGGNVMARLEMVAVPSGAKVYVRTTDANGVAITEYQEVTDKDGAAFVFTIAGTQASYYQFFAESTTGQKAESNLYQIKIDAENLVFDPISQDGSTFVEGTGENQVTWFTSVAEFTYRYQMPASGARAQYQFKSLGAEAFGDWQDVKTAQGALANILRVEDANRTKGGLRFVYQFRVINGAGGVSAVQTKNVNIDMANYTATLEQTFMDAGVSLASATNTSIARFKRGDIFESDLKVNQTAGAFLKTVGIFFQNADDDIQIGSTVEFSQTDQTTTLKLKDDTNYRFFGKDIVIKASFYKNLEVQFENLQQAKQAGELVAVGVRFVGLSDEFLAMMDEIENAYELQYYVGGKWVLAAPDKLGAYNVKLELSEETKKHFIVTDETGLQKEMVVRYFEKAGTANNPYEILTKTDLDFVETYMKTELTYLGNVGAAANFLQKGTIALDSGFAPLCKTLPMAGVYNGGGYQIEMTGTGFTVEEDALFALFAKVSGTVQNVTLVLAKGTVITVAGKNALVGLLVAEAKKGAKILHNTVLGNVEIKATATNAKVGGLVGEATACRITNNFSDVNIKAYADNVVVGGMVGAFLQDGEDAPQFFANYSISSVLVGESAQGVTAGALVGSAPNSIQMAEGDNRYHQTTLTQNGRTIDLPFGNGEEGRNIPHVVGLPFDDFIKENTLVGGKAVQTLAKLRFGQHGITQTGTQDSPIVLTQAADIWWLDVFPFARFEIKNTFHLPGQVMLGKEVAFRGSLVGNNGQGTMVDVTGHVLNLEEETPYVGLFAKLWRAEVANLRFVGAEVTSFVKDSQSGTAGILAGVMRESTLTNVVVDGTLKMVSSNENGTTIAGGLVGVVNSSTVKNVMMHGDVVAEGVRLVAGGLFGQAERQDEMAATFDNLVSAAVLEVSYTKTAYIGGGLGAIKNSNIVGTRVYILDGGFTILGKKQTASYGKNESAMFERVAPQSYRDLVQRLQSEKTAWGGMAAADSLAQLFPFATEGETNGRGTPDSPFVIGNYRDLLKMANYPYAFYQLKNDIWVGDLDGDGALTNNDGYEYDFKPLAGRFEGGLDGNNKTIFGLTDALFETFGGTLKNITLSLDIKRFSAGDARLNDNANKNAQAASVHGVAAGAIHTLVAGATVSNVKLVGNITLSLQKGEKVVVGGIASKMQGGTLTGVISTLAIHVETLFATVGGLVGELTGGALMSNMVRRDITVQATQVNAGLQVGTNLSKVATIDTTTQGTQNNVVQNGTSHKNAVGFSLWES